MKNTTIKTTIAIILVLTLINFSSGISETKYLDDYVLTSSYVNAEEGETFSLNVEINNTGDAKQNVVFELDDSGPLDIDSDDKWEIGEISSQESITKTFRIEVDKGTKQGKYDLEFQLEDEQDDFEDELEIEVESDEPDFIVGNVQSFPDTILPDQDEVKLDITLENIGGGDAEFVKVKLNLPKGFSASGSFSDQNSLGKIAEGQGKTATFFIDTEKDLSSGQNTATLEIEYKTNTEIKTQKLDFQLPVKGKPQFKILSSIMQPSKITPGQTGSVEIKIKNIGEETGEETSIRVFENIDIPIEFEEKTRFIGDLKPGQTGTAVLSFEVESDATPSSYLIQVQTRTINRENVLTEEFNIPLQLSEAETNTGFWLIAGIVISIIILISIIIILLRR